MRIVVLLRRLRRHPDGEGTNGVNGVGELLGRCDDAALRLALALRGDAPGTIVIALAAGAPEQEDPVLRHALASGADRAVRVSDPGLATVDYHGIARVLAAAVTHLGALEKDLVVCGNQSEDEAQGAVGPAVAEWLTIPHLTGILDAKLTGEGAAVLATRRDPGHIRTLKVSLPALLTVTSCSRPAPSATASTAPVEALELAALGIQAMELKHRDGCLGNAHPVSVTRNATVVKDPDELVARLREERLV